MLTKKKKLSKKEIKEDKLVTSYVKVTQFYEEYQQKIFLVVGAIAVIVVAIILYQNKLADDNIAASDELARVSSIYTAGSYQEAIDGRPGTNINGLKYITEEYGSSEQGEIAKIYLANSYLFLGRIDEALEAYGDYSGSNDIFRATAYAGQASCYESKGNYEKAADLFDKAASVSEFVPANGEYLLNSGINYFKLGKLKEAKTRLERVKKEYTTSQASRAADRYLAQI